METQSTLLPGPQGPRLVVERAVLFVEVGPEEGRELVLAGGPATLGRGEDADLQLADPGLAPRHVRFEPHGPGWRVVDLGGPGGTLVDGVQVGAAALELGQRLRLGGSELVVGLDRQELAAAPAASGVPDILGESAAMRELFGVLARLAPLAIPVLLQGETGTGKEALAKLLHRRGPAAGGPYEVVDCTLLGDGTALRSELFGHLPGAYSGAGEARIGAFERAHGGTLVLDEVGELPAELQPQLLRVLQEGEVRPLGGGEPRRVRVRVVAATHRDLAAEVAAGRFRQDLLQRLAGVTLRVPPLRERGQDVLLLAERFLPAGATLAASARSRLLEYPWPGNVRQLQGVLARAAALGEGPVLRAEDLRLEAAPGLGGRSIPAAPRTRAAQLSDAVIREALAQAGGNRSEAARLLGIGRTTLYRRLAGMGEG